jgi:hypothetical protein
MMREGDRHSCLVALRVGEPAVTVGKRKTVRQERWWFRCDCGAEKLIRIRDVLRGATKCYQQRAARGVKWCPGCKCDVALGLFGEATRRVDGRAAQCLACTAKYAQGRYRADVEASRAVRRTYAKASYDAGKRSRPPERAKANAHAAVYRALKRGEVMRPENCSHCGKADRIEGHHDDYSRPLDVMWLCVMCHRERHAELAAKGIDPDDTMEKVA